ncbi:allophanate hydrolase [Acidisphaera sp. L21]|uniref:allophanate hydrolase n=1 Tax=Acidisphaera sp. L21 TaxID=1641851 RepID=UPI00131EA63E|nr:allophanate hydrolase [Acidisphaera sp. L21]
MNFSSPVSAVQAALAADAAHADPAIWITRIPDAEILARAAVLEAEGPQDRPLWGVPFAVKDNIDVAGVPTTAACPGYAFTPTVHAPAVQRLLDAGAVLIGKTNLDQFATGLVGVRSPYGVPRNVFDPARVPGGSSSGSGAVVAAGIVPFALGTDTAGSGRVPAMFGNIVGLKPTIGSVSARGMIPACRSIDTISVFARSVDEALEIARIIAALDEADPYSRAAPVPHLRRGAPATMRVASVAADICAPEQARLYRAAAASLGAAEVDITPLLQIAHLLYDGPWVAERTAALRGVLQTPDILHPTTRAILEGGLDRRTVDAFDAFHQLAQARRFATQLFARFDVLLLPTAPNTPSLADLAADPIGPNSRLGTWTNFVNLCDLAAWAVPSGMGADGLPGGITLVGPAWSEGRLAALADQLHRAATNTVGATAAPLPQPATPDAAGPNETELFCIGGHMAGLPLNGQVTALGGRFVAEAKTVPGYRLYALGNRPGLVATQGGASIAGEIWALPTTAIGPLLAQIPPPLGFGTVLLQSGPCLGFLAEAAGVAGAQDITAHGGWRAYLAATAITDFIRAGAALMRLPIDPAWEAGIAFNLRTILAQAATLTDPPLPDLLDPAPVFRA